MATKTNHRPLRLVLVRHGESQSNIYQALIDKGEVFGYPPEFAKVRDWDINLTKKGRIQAFKTGTFLKKNFGAFHACYISPFNRTRQTFEEILRGYADPKAKKEMLAHTRYDSRLREKDHGAINFLSRAEVRRHHPHEFERREREGKFLYRPLGGESWYDVKDLRVGGILNTIYRDHRGESVLVIAHSIVLKCFRMKLERMNEVEYEKVADKTHLDNCGVSLYEYTERAPGHGKLTLKYWNKKAY